MPMDHNLGKESVARIADLVQQAEAVTDPAARAVTVELVQAVLEFHAVSLDRILEVVSAESQAASDALFSDDLVSSVLVLHGLHRDSTETRVNRAMEKLQRYFDSRGAGIVLLGLESGTVRVRFTGTRPGAGAAAKGVIEDAIYEAAPEIAGLVIEGIEERREPGFVPLSDLLARQAV
jgi:hypothetical protein